MSGFTKYISFNPFNVKKNWHKTLIASVLLSIYYVGLILLLRPFALIQVLPLKYMFLLGIAVVATINVSVLLIATIKNLSQVLNYILLFLFSILIIIALTYLVLSNYEPVAELKYSEIIMNVLIYSVLPVILVLINIETNLKEEDFKIISSESIRSGVENPDVPFEINIQSETKQSFNITLNDLICIKSEQNYSTIYYLHNRELKSVLLRVTLKGIEKQLENNESIIRCHNSFMVNIRHIEKISGNARGYKFNCRGIDFDIPVSRTFPKENIEKIRTILK